MLTTVLSVNGEANEDAEMSSEESAQTSRIGFAEEQTPVLQARLGQAG